MKAPETVRDYLRLFFRRKYVIVVPIVCSVFLIIPIWKIGPDKYRASALVKRKDLALTNAAAGAMMVHDGGPVAVDTMRTEILTHDNLQRVIIDLKLDVDLKTPRDWESEFAQLKKSITIKTAAQGRGVDLIEIAVLDEDPSHSQQIANAIADHYVEDSQRNSRTDTMQSIEYFKTQCDENLAIIRNMDKELDKYTREHWTELPEVKRGILSTLQTLRTTEGSHLLLLSAAQNRLTEIERQVKEVEKTIKNDVQTMDNPARQELQNQLMQRQKRLTEMLVNYTEDHPQVKAVREEIATLQAQLKDTPERVPGSIHETINPVYQQLVQARMTAEQEVKAEEASLRETKAQIMANETSIRKVVDEEKQYADIQRTHDEAKDAYEQYHKSLLALQNRSRVQNEPIGTQVEIIQRALKPVAPDRGYRWPLAIACVGGAAAAGFVLTFLLEFVDHSLRGPADAAESLGVPVLATLTELPAPASHDPARARRRLIFYIAFAVLMLGVLTATVIEGIAPDSLHGFGVWLKQLTH